MTHIDAMEDNTKDQSVSKEMEDLLEYMMLPPTKSSQRRLDLVATSTPLPPLEINEEKVSFEIEMRSVFVTEEQNWGKRLKYTKKQLENLQELISIVQDYLYKNNLILQTKEYDPPYLWNDKRVWKKETAIRRKNKMFPELDYFNIEDNIYYYFAEYSHTFEQKDTSNYQLFFAFRLRQMLLDDLEEFLTVTSKEFDGEFKSFLELILVKYNCLFSKQTKTISKKWIKKIKHNAQAITRINTQPEGKKIIAHNGEQSFLETPFLTPPDDYITIKGKLKESQIKKYFPFYIKKQMED